MDKDHQQSLIQHEQAAIEEVRRLITQLPPELYAEYEHFLQAQSLINAHDLASVVSADVFAEQLMGLVMAKQRIPQLQQLIEAHAQMLLAKHIVEAEELRVGITNRIRKATINASFPAQPRIIEASPPPIIQPDPVRLNPVVGVAFIIGTLVGTCMLADPVIHSSSPSSLLATPLIIGFGLWVAYLIFKSAFP